MTGGLLMFFFQFVVMMGLFFVIPLYLSVALGLSAIDTGIKITPLSVTMLLAAAGIPQVLPGGLAPTGRRARVRRGGDRHRGALQRDGRRTRARAIVTVPLLLIGLGIGAPRLAARERHRLRGPRRAEPRGRRPPEHGLAVRRVARHGARGFDPDRLADGVVPDRDRQQPRRAAAGRVPGERAALERRGIHLRCPARNGVAGCRGPTRRPPGHRRRERAGPLDGLRSALALLAIVGVVALFFTRRIPTVQPVPPRLRTRSSAAERSR